MPRFVNNSNLPDCSLPNDFFRNKWINDWYFFQHFFLVPWLGTTFFYTTTKRGVVVINFFLLLFCCSIQFGLSQWPWDFAYMVEFVVSHGTGIRGLQKFVILTAVSVPGFANNSTSQIVHLTKWSYCQLNQWRKIPLLPHKMSKEITYSPTEESYKTTMILFTTLHYYLLMNLVRKQRTKNTQSRTILRGPSSITFAF